MTIALVRVRYLAAYVQAYEGLGGNAGRLLRETRVSAELLASPHGLLPLQRVMQFVHLAAREVGPALGSLAAPQRLCDLGDMSARLASAPSLRHAFALLSQLARAEATGIELFMQHREGAVWLCRTPIPVNDEILLGQIERFVVQAMLMLARDWLGEAWRPEELWLLSAPQPGDDRFREIPRVRYRAPLLAFPVPLRDAYAPRRASSREPSQPSGGDPLSLDELSFLGSLTRLLETQLPAGRVSLRDTAELLDTSPRTLQRRLDEHGFAYSSLLDEVRQKVALDRLRTTNAPITLIAQELGYSDSAHFARAFRRWAGMSPLAVRRLHREQ